MNMEGEKKWIDEELVCADSLVYCLKNDHFCHQVEVKREDNDPPDFWITINGEIFAAEVTSIVKDYDYHVQCRRFKDEMKRSASALEILCGTYALEIRNRPEFPSRNSPQYLDLLKFA